MRNKFLLLVLFLNCCALMQLHAQITVRGIVTDATGETIIGGSVLIEGTGDGTATDIDGSYEIQVPDESTVLNFSYIGLQEQSITVGSQRTIDVVLKENISMMEEVVVLGYGTEKRSKISGAVSTVTAEEITETPVLRVEQALQGRVAGVQISQFSGSPGSALTVRIRGVGTINNSDPLYIVDGIPVDGIDFLNPNDIETINVLKDGASAAIYGSRGANGVVLITTKGGTFNQEGKITYESYYGVQSPWKMMHLLNAEEYAIISNEAHINSGMVPLTEFRDPSRLGEGTDWQSALFQDAPMYSHQLGFQGGGEKSSYALSGNYFGQDGIVGGEKSGFERYTVRFNANSQLKNWLKVGSNMGFTYIERGFLAENNVFVTPLIRALNMDPVTPVRKPDGTYAYSYYSDTDITNPINAIEQTYDTWTSQRVVGAIFGEASITENLKFKSTYSVDATFATRDRFNPIYNLSVDTTINDAPASEMNIRNGVGKEHNTWRNWQWENVLTYNKSFADIHNFQLIAGNTVLSNRFDFAGGGNNDLPSNNPDDAFISNTIGPITSQTAYAGATESSLLSAFAKLNYDYMGKYVASFTFRADGSSKFGANNRFGYFPSASFAWVITEEDFFANEAFSLLKLRASWGQNGNDRIGDYGFTTIVNAGQNYSFDGVSDISNGNVALTAANPDLKWETSTQTNIGLDAELYDGRINVVVDYYRKNTSDMLYAAPIPRTAGTFAPVRNIGDVLNAGLELSASYRNRDNAFKYEIGGNIAFVSSEVTGLGEGGDPISTGNVFSAGNVARTEVGQPIASFYGYVTDGIFQNQEEVNAHAFQNENTVAGDIRFVDLNNDGIINNEDQTYIGNPTPDFTYGINLSAEYKNFDISTFLQGVYGNEIYNGTVRYDFSYTNRPQSVLNRWTGEGTSTEEPRVAINDFNNNARVSDRFVEDGSYMRIKNVQLGYNVPRTILEKLKFDKIRLYVSATNLLTFTKYSGLDPEIGATQVFDGNNPYRALDIGIDRGFYPQARVFLGGINVVF